MTSPVSAIEAIEKARLAIRIGGSTTAYAYTETDDDGDYITVEDAKAIILALARQAEELQRENAELREALKPFAECAPEWESEPDSLHVFLEWNDEKAPVPSLPVADFRHARALLGVSNAE